MSANRIIIATLLMIPFLFVSGIITSSIEDLAPLYNGKNYIWMSRVSDCGRRLEKASEKIVYMEVDIVQKVIADLLKTRYVKDNSSFSGLKSLTRKDV